MTKHQPPKTQIRGLGKKLLSRAEKQLPTKVSEVRVWGHMISTANKTKTWSIRRRQRHVLASANPFNDLYLPQFQPTTKKNINPKDQSTNFAHLKWRFLVRNMWLKILQSCYKHLQIQIFILFWIFRFFFLLGVFLSNNNKFQSWNWNFTYLLLGLYRTGCKSSCSQFSSHWVQ